jgi:hypothetical protein
MEDPLNKFLEAGKLIFDFYNIMDITANTAEAVTVSLQELVDGKSCVKKKE